MGSPSTPRKDFSWASRRSRGSEQPHFGRSRDRPKPVIPRCRFPSPGGGTAIRVPLGEQARERRCSLVLSTRSSCPRVRDRTRCLPSLLLTGDIEFDHELVDKLERVLTRGCTVLLSPAHQAALESRFPRLARHSGIEVLQAWVNPETGRSAAISDPRLQRLAHEESFRSGFREIPSSTRSIAGPAVGWSKLINNAGVVKKPDQPAVTNPGSTAKVVLHPRIHSASAREWRSNRPYPKPDEVRLEVGPGQSAFVEFICP